ncbi:MAG: hypothetical protein MZW92_48280 [Comamonadaceae bacterium]|nr:hypothetical protein [Comamonadaceae bacterium]
MNAALRELEHDLDTRGIRFRPHWWLSDCWFSPDGVPGFAIPFYLAHPRPAEASNSSSCSRSTAARAE